MKWCTKVVFGKTLTQNCCKKMKAGLVNNYCQLKYVSIFQVLLMRHIILTNTFQERESLLRVSKINRRST